MLVQEYSLPLPYTGHENDNTKSVLIDQFLEEAIQILKNADLVVNTSNYSLTCDDDSEEDTEDPSLQWRLFLTDRAMTLDTNIATISGLEKVLELVRSSAQLPAEKYEKSKKINPGKYGIPVFHGLLEPILRLSSTLSKPNIHLLDRQSSIQFMHQCIRRFVECGYSFFLDVPSLISHTEMVIFQPGASTEHTVETLLILSICTLMARHTVIHHGGNLDLADCLTHAYYTQAYRTLQEVFDVHHIAVVQSMFILSVYPQGHIHLLSPYRSNSFLLTMSIRMALSMNLHQLDLECTKGGPEKERLRRFAWILLCADYFTAWNQNDQNYGHISISDWHVDFPQRLPDEQYAQKIDYFSQYCRVIMLRKMDFYKSLLMISLHSSRTWDALLDIHYYLVYFDIPDMFRMDLLNHGPVWDKPSEMESLLLYELYSHTQIFAQLPFLPRHYFTAFMAEEESFIQLVFKDLYQSMSYSNPCLPPHGPQSQHYLPTEHDVDLEFHCVVGCLTIVNYYTLILEALTSMDPYGCHHSPMYGAVLTSHLYIIISKACLDPDIRSLCQINLIRTQRLLMQIKIFCSDPAILFLERTFIKHCVPSKDDISTATLCRRSHTFMTSLQSRVHMHKSYEDNDESSNCSSINEIKQEFTS